MKQRCTNTKKDGFEQYGGRGIKVCDRWMHSFDNWLADMGPRPGPNYSLERKDVDGDYSPTNCIWATAAAQQWNRRDTRMVEFKGRYIAAAELIKTAPISMHVNTFMRRVTRGWSVERALTTPIRPLQRRPMRALARE